MGWWATSAFFLGCFWHQLVFTAHDAGHMGITHNFHVDTVIGMFIADYLGGLSLGWWKRSHNVHHIVTNEPEHDPDIEHIPFFCAKDSPTPRSAVDIAKWDKVIWTCSGEETMCETRRKMMRLLASGSVLYITP